MKLNFTRSSIVFMVVAFFLLFMFVVLESLDSKTVIIIFLSLFMLFISTKCFYIGCFVNIVLLIYLPFMLIENNHVLLNRNETFTLIFILCAIFLTSIFDFLILAYHINNSDKNCNFYITSFFNRPFLKILCIFFLYLSLLFSVIDSFALLYTHLSNIFNEGIIGEDEIFSHLDALYFSTTTFFTIGFGDIRPSEYSEITKRLVIIQAIISHIITTVLWPVAIIFVFGKSTKKIFSKDMDIK
ncbi:ion channel [Vallitalea sp.]|uniref:ion channel n=1 Tax=Vallitalea sp. TaxID=1882829 RepID=UPI0025E3B5DA|nr:ion channel [Vallitalea sp.]MCT4687755.1 ion channel [Vallitalea sp.]